MTSILKATLVLALLMVGTFATLGAAHAQSEEHRGLVGSIKGTPAVTVNGSVISGSFVLTLKGKDGEVTSPMTIKVNEATKFKVPGDKNVKLSNYTNTFKDGSRVAVLAKKVGSDYFALHMHLIPGKPVHAHRVGTVTGCLPDCTKALTSTPPLASFTLEDKKGEASTFVVNKDTKITYRKGATAVTVGERAAVVARRDPGTDQFTARHIVVFATKDHGPKK